MIIPHLMFAHMLADYVLQSNWLVAQKSKAWTGLALHAGMVGFTAMVVLTPYLSEVWSALIVLVALHWTQDYLKIYFGPRLHVHPFVPYAIDQLAHYVVIIGIQLWVGDRIAPEPSRGEIAFMWVGAAAITVTRFYEVTWWANWLDMIPYMKRWRTYGYAERLAMLALATAGLWMVAPVAAIPRLILFGRTLRPRPAWKRRRALLEILVGIGLSVALGVGLSTVW